MIQPSTLQFLKNLNTNNNKEWFETNRHLFENARENFLGLVQQIINGVKKFDPELKETEAKKTIYRQHRDIRFSKDKTPYKVHFGMHLSRGGKTSNYAGYYFHLEPGNRSIAGGGIWMPEPADIKKIRQEIDYSCREFQDIISSKSFIKHYKGLDESPEYRLVNIPKGYEKDDPAAEYLKFKSIIATRNISDEELTHPGLAKSILKSYEALMPLVKFVNRALD